MHSQSAQQPPIGVAIAGLGFGEAVHLPALQANPGLKPVALWHPRQERLDQACTSHGLKGFTEWDAVLSDPAVDAVIITTPPAPRHDLARRALEAGKHLLLEKPVALHADQVADLQRLAVQKRLSVAVDFEYRAVPLFMQAARLLQAGAIGTPWLVKYDWLMSSRANAQRPWSWYSDAAQGGGVIGALGTHAFDTLHWLIGPSTDLRALHHTAIGQRPTPSGEMVLLMQRMWPSFRPNFRPLMGRPWFLPRSAWPQSPATAGAAGLRSTALKAASPSAATTRRTTSMGSVSA